MLAASPISCTASEIATLPVMAPPINSKMEKERFSKNAIKIFFSVFHKPSTLTCGKYDCTISSLLNILFNKNIIVPGEQDNI